ncbi:MAG TPA: hypothetical protein VJK29_11740 [Terriglobales bacterium]|nr:hypothetical protein [Terriglobales bacterium]
MDYEKIAAAAVQVMTTADLHRFLVVCALVSDLYCPGYNPRQTLAKNSNLARTSGPVQGRFRNDSHSRPSGTVEQKTKQTDGAHHNFEDYRSETQKIIIQSARLFEKRSLAPSLAECSVVAQFIP